MGKITITKKQAENYNRMLKALKTISREYETPAQIRKSSESSYGLEYEEALEYAYENIQQRAKQDCKNVKPL